jgi:hypothetical protein
MGGMTDSPVDGFVLLKFKPEALAANGWPLVDYPVPSEAVDALLEGGGQLEAPNMLAWMQQYVTDKQAPWREYRDAMLALLAMCTADDERRVIDIRGDTWSLVCGAVDLDAKLVSFCRDGELLAIAGKNDDGRLRVTCYQALDGRTLSSILQASLLPAPDGTVCMRPNNWEYLGDNACGSGQIYACLDGRSHMALWDYGFGVTADREPDPNWHSQRDVTPLSAGALAASLGVYYERGPDIF